MSKHISKCNETAEFYTPEGCYILELLNTKDDEDCSIARARVPVGVTTQLHSLTETIERYVIIDGTGVVEINGERSEEVRALDVVHIPEDVSQRITNNGSTDLVFLCVCTPRFKQENYVLLE